MTILDFNDARTAAQIEAEKHSRGSLDADRIRQAVTAQARTFVQWLFPASVVHRSGRHAVVGDIYGSPGESLHIELAGPRTGFWRDWASTGEEGKDLIGLYMASMGLDRTQGFREALRQISSEFLNDVALPHWQRPVTKKLRDRAEEHKDKPRPNIDDRPPPTVSYQYEGHNGQIIGIVRRHESDELDERTGKPRKTFSVWDATAGKAQAPTPRPLYRIPQISRVNHVVFVEGEKKADALAASGIEATCIMFGSNAPLDKVDWTPIAGKTITVWPDADLVGGKFAERLAPVLIGAGCRIAYVQLPEDATDGWDAADCIAEGRDPADFINSAIPHTPTEKAVAPRIRVIDIDEFEDLAPPSWLIDGVITCNGLSVLWGRSGDMKSFVAVDMALCVASGQMWHGKAVNHGLVIYIAAEGSFGLAKRALGWWKTRGKDLAKPLFKLVPHALTLTGDDLDHLVTAIAALDQKPVLIIVDTMARTFGNGDENKQADMNAYVNAADRLREATGANVMVVHHSGVGENKRERGSNVLRGAADTLIKVERTDTAIDIINKSPEGKQKDAEEFETIKLRTQKVSYSHRKEEHSTLILNLREDTDATGNTLRSASKSEDMVIGPVEKAIIKALKSASQPLGFMRLIAITGANRGSLSRAVDSLTAKNLIEEVPSSDQNGRLWTLV